MSNSGRTLSQQIAGKWQALSALASQLRYFKNGMEVFRAFRAAQPLPPLQLRSGLTLFHGPTDNACSLFREIFVERCYTRDGFYSPAPSDCVMDFGANIGFFAAYLQCAAPGINVHCFEPAASTR